MSRRPKALFASKTTVHAMVIGLVTREWALRYLSLTYKLTPARAEKLLEMAARELLEEGRIKEWPPAARDPFGLTDDEARSIMGAVILHEALREEEEED